MSEYLCPEHDERAAMTDAEFWVHVANNLLGPQWDGRDEPDIPDEVEMAEMHLSDPCPECGSRGACGYDDMGRPLIHSTQENTDEA